jgi:Ca2+-binding EF-hand superfamily protein
MELNYMDVPRFDVDHDSMISVSELQTLLTKLNDGIEVSLKEAQWVMSEIDITGKGGLVRSELREAVAMWYPNIYNRRNLKDLQKSVDATAGPKRLALAAQIMAHEEEVVEAMHCVVGHKTSGITAAELQAIMLRLSQGQQISGWALRFVMATADVHHEDEMNKQDILRALAMWRALQKRQQIMVSPIAKFDASSTGTLGRDELRLLLTELNEGTLVSAADTTWVMDAAMSTDGNLDRDELRAAVALWYFHIISSKIDTRAGWKAQVDRNHLKQAHVTSLPKVVCFSGVT